MKQLSWEVTTRSLSRYDSPFPLSSLFEQSDSTRTDVRSENHQLQARLKNVISLEKMKQALEKKDLDLAAAQKEAQEKTALADKRLALVGKLEEENSKLKTAVSDANREVERLKKDKDKLTDEIGSLKAKKGELESYLGQLAAKLVLKLEGTDVRLTCCGRLTGLITLLEFANLPSAYSLPSAGGRQRRSLPSACKKRTAKNWLMAKNVFAISQFFAVY